jgi:transcriptional regulator with XRE-family HTH domain
MMAITPPSRLRPRRAQLAEELKRLRLSAGLSTYELSDRLEADLGRRVSQSKVSKMETGRQSASVPDVTAWARATSAPAGQVARLTELAQAALMETTAWREATKGGLPALQYEISELEASARVIRNFQPTLVPGLLQTRDYAWRVVSAGYPEGRADLAAAINARMDRQVILHDDAKRLEYVISEAALRWRLGPPAVMLAQLDRIGQVMSWPGVSIGLLPLAVEIAAWHTHGFVIYDDREDDDPVVQVETLVQGLIVTDEHAVGRYREAFHLLRETAVFGDEAQALLGAVMGDLRRE